VPLLLAELAAYGAPDGIQRLKDALAAHMSRNFGGFEFSPQHMICAAGCTPLLDMFAFCTCDDGDGIMLPTPYYPGFAIEVCYKTGAKLLPLHTAAPDFRVTAAGLRECYDNATKAGTRVRGLLLTNPTNPLGTTMNREELGAAIDFVREVGIHLLADEVYAQSVYGTAEGAEEFVSVSTLCKERGEPLGDQLHVMYGFSKDFCMSGIRAAVLYSENAALHGAMGNIGYFNCISHQTQHTLAGVLEKDGGAAIDGVLSTLRGDLRDQYTCFSAHLERLGIAYVPSCAGLFTCVNLRQYLEEDSWEGEVKLQQRVFEECKAVLTPGADCKMHEPGWFRCCWASIPQAGYDAFFARFEATFAAQGGGGG